MPELTEVLNRTANGDCAAAAELLPLVYEELRKLAAARMTSERDDHTLQSTALVHEAYLRLVRTDDDAAWESRGHFFAAAAEAMRRILIESARARQRIKRGGDLQQSELHEHIQLPEESIDDLLDINSGLDQLAAVDAVAAELVKLRLFAGMSVTEAGKMLGLPRSTAYANWEFARSWLAANMDSPLAATKALDNDLQS